MIPNPLTLEELSFILLLSVPIMIWGYRHGLDAAIIAVIGVLAGMAFADFLVGGTVAALNTFWRLFNAIVGGGFGSPEFFTMLSEGPGLIETPQQIQLLGSIVFLAMTYVGFRIAFKRAGGRSNIFEGIFGALGAAVVGYLIITFLLMRHVQLPQVVQISETTELPGFALAEGQPDITLNANVVVLLALVIIVFGVQNSKRKR